MEHKEKKSVSGKWETSYTFLLVANALYILLFYLIMNHFS
jgi:hypothetical protein